MWLGLKSERRVPSLFSCKSHCKLTRHRWIWRSRIPCFPRNRTAKPGRGFVGFFRWGWSKTQQSFGGRTCITFHGATILVWIRWHGCDPLPWSAHVLIFPESEETFAWWAYPVYETDERKRDIPFCLDGDSVWNGTILCEISTYLPCSGWVLGTCFFQYNIG